MERRDYLLNRQSMIIMATLRGKGSFKERDLIVKIPVDPPMGKDGKELNARFVEIQLDQSNRNPDTVARGTAKTAEGAVAPQTNPYLHTSKVEKEDGSTYLSHNVSYSLEQVKKITEAAGKNHFQMESETGKKYDVYGVNANLMIANKDNPEKKRVIINTKQPMGPTKNKHFDANVLTRQYSVTKAANDFRRSQSGAEKGAEVEATNEFEAPDVDLDMG